MSREATLRSWSERDIAVLDAAVKMSDGGWWGEGELHAGRASDIDDAFAD